MKTEQKSSKLIVLALLSGALMFDASAAIITYAYNGDSSGTGGGYTVLNNDLLQANLLSKTATGDFIHYTPTSGCPGVSGLADGVFGDTGDGVPPAAMAAAAMAGFGEEVIYNLNTSINTAGYNLSQIATYSGWNWTRAAQVYDVYVHKVSTAAGTYVKIASIDYFPEWKGNAKVVIAAEGTDTWASNVDQVKFVFQDQTQEILVGYCAYRELDVVGTAAAVPEPATLALLMAGGLLLGRRSRRN